MIQAAELKPDLLIESARFHSQGQQQLHQPPQLQPQQPLSLSLRASAERAPLAVACAELCPHRAVADGLQVTWGEAGTPRTCHCEAEDGSSSAKETQAAAAIAPLLSSSALLPLALAATLAAVAVAAPVVAETIVVVAVAQPVAPNRYYASASGAGRVEAYTPQFPSLQPVARLARHSAQHTSANACAS